MGSLRNDLQTRRTDTILNTIDRLRQLGLGGILELPQIIVCGDQSSGKSSVLNAVSTLQFPIKDGLCTRFATEVIMRPGEHEHIVVTIVPGSSCSDPERRALEMFQQTNVSMEDIADIITKATSAMGIDPRNPAARRFSDDILRFEVTGPSQPSLTLVDLPGLFQAESVYQTKEDIASVQELVLRYMRNKRSVILAVISGKSDFVLQSVTEFSRDVDPKGLRTLGIITKPDKLDVGSDNEKSFVELAENKLRYLHRGWHVLVNRDHGTRTTTQDERDNFERDFLSRGLWAKLPASHKGVFSLRTRLSITLQEHILEGLPDLIGEAEEEVARCDKVLLGLGISRASEDERRRYLMEAAHSFNAVMRSSINGSYDDQYFKCNTSSAAFRCKRLRAVVQEILTQYSNDMQQRGHAKHILDSENDLENNGHPQRVTQSEFEDTVVNLMTYSRGRELTIAHNPMIVQELFQAQSEPWIKLAAEYRLKILKAATTSIDLALQYVTDEHTKTRLENSVIRPSLDKLLDELHRMISRLLRPRSASHPITYTRRLPEYIEKANQQKAEKMFAAKWERVTNQGAQVVPKDTLRWLSEEFVGRWSTELPRFAASEAIIQTRAYYKIAKETFVDNFSTLAIEDCLISEIPNLFSPAVVAGLDDDTISEIAMETETAAWERDQTNYRLELCLSALKDLRMIENMRHSATRMYDTQSPSPSSGSQADDHELGLVEPTEVSLSNLDPGLSELENGESLANEIIEDVVIRPPMKRKHKKGVVRQESWMSGA